jgi:hypothetical protein
MGIIYRPAFNLKNVSEIAVCLRLNEMPIQVGPIERAGLCSRPNDV